MTGQPTLDGGPGTDRDPLKAGIHPRRADGIRLYVHDWHRANDRREIVGTCRVRLCGGLMQAVDTQEDGGGITWYGAECLNCGHEVVAPNGRVLARSSRHHEMPDGWWGRRNETFKAEAEIRKRKQQKEAA